MHGYEVLRLLTTVFMFCPIAKEGSGLGSHFLGGFIGPSTAFSAFDKEQ